MCLTGTPENRGESILENFQDFKRHYCSYPEITSIKKIKVKEGSKDRETAGK